MKPKKVFIISFNKIPTDFWEYHLNFENIQLLHWRNHELGLKNLDIIRPDILIIDGYFAKESYEACLRKAIRLKPCLKIFCLTPLPKSYNTTVFIHERLIVSRLDLAVIKQINEELNPVQGQNLLNLTG